MNALLMRVALGLLILVAAFSGGFGAGHHIAAQAGAAKVAAIQVANAEQLARAQQAARAKEQLAADTMAAIDAKHQKEMNDAQAAADRTIADLRAGTLRLRAEWRGCAAMPSAAQAAAGSGQPDAAADDRAASAARIVRAADDADSTIRALQAVVKADRQ